MTMCDSTAWAVIVDRDGEIGGWEALFMERENAEEFAATIPPHDRPRVVHVLISTVLADIPNDVEDVDEALAWVERTGQLPDVDDGSE